MRADTRADSAERVYTDRLRTVCEWDDFSAVTFVTPVSLAAVVLSYLLYIFPMLTSKFIADHIV